MSRAKVMISSAVFLDDMFLDLSYKAQALYVHLNVQADNDGVVEGIKRIIRGFGCDDGVLQELFAAGYLQTLGNAVVITHYWVNNNRDSKYGHGQHHDTLLKHFALDKETKTYVPLEQATVESGEARESFGEDSAPNINECNSIEANAAEENPNKTNPNLDKMNLNLKQVRCPGCGKDALASRDDMTGTRFSDCVHCGERTPLDAIEDDIPPVKAP